MTFMSLKTAGRIGLMAGLMLGLYVSLGSASCSNNSALPQASIPAPANDCGDSGSTACVTVSSPDSEGFVTITGAEGAVPESATVEIRVSGATSFLRWIDGFCPSAYASTCESELPECSSDGATEDCHTTAESDGSFVVRIEADLDNTISIVYLDPDTCETSEAYEETVTSDLVTLEMEGVALAYNRASSTGYVFGYAPTGDSSTDEIQMATLSIGGGAVSVSSVTDLDLLDDNPISMDNLPNAEQFVFQSRDGVVMISAEDSSSLTRIRIAPDLDESTDQNPDEFLVQKNFNYSAISDTSSACTTTSGTTDRIFMPATSDTLASSSYSSVPYFVLDPRNSSADEENFYYGNAVHYMFSSSELESLSLETVYQLYIAENGSKGFFIAGFSDGNKYLVEMPVYRAYCTTTNVNVADEDLTVVRLSSELTNPGPATFLGEFGLSSGDVGNGEQVLVVPDLGTGNLFTIDYSRVSSDDWIDVINELGLSSFTSVSEVIQSRLAADYSGLQLVFTGAPNSLGVFGLEGESLDGLVHESSFNIGINPNDIQFVTTIDFNATELTTETLLESFNDASSVLVLSGGGDGDGFSFLRLIPLSETE